MNSAKTVGQKVGLKDRRAPWSKKWGGARAQRANRSVYAYVLSARSTPRKRKVDLERTKKRLGASVVHSANDLAMVDKP